MTHFIWDSAKEVENIAKHRVDFRSAQLAFDDPNRIIAHDEKHSQWEQRFFCLGKVRGNILTVRFTYRESVIRIIGAGYWRKGAALYAKKNKAA